MPLTGASTPVVTAKWLNVSFTKLNWIANAEAILDVFSSVTTSWIHDVYGIKPSIILASVITVVGCWIRCIAVLVPVDHRYIVFIIGQSFGSIGNPIVVNLVTKIVATWFAPHDRGTATNILTLHVGGALAPLVLPAIAQSPEDVPKMLVIIACISTICLIPALLLPKKPKIPPSASAESKRVSSWEGIKLISKNVQFWWIVAVSSVQFGITLAFSTVMLEVIIPYGYTEQQAGFCEAIIVISGFFGGGMNGYWIGKTGQLVMLMKIFAPAPVFGCIALIFNIIPNSFSTVFTTCMLYGFFGYGVIPIFFELASEESISASIIWTFSSINMLIFTVILDALRAGPEASPPNNMRASMIAVSIIIGVGTLPVIWIKGDLKRLKVDNGDNKNLEKDSV